MDNDDFDAVGCFNGLSGLHFRKAPSRNEVTGRPVRIERSELLEVSKKLSTGCCDGVMSEDWERLEKIRGLAELFDEVLFWCWNVKTEEGYKIRKYRAAQNRFVALTALIKPEIFDGKSYEEIGEKIGTTKQHLSDMARDFQNCFGLKFQRSHKADNLHSAAAKESWKNPDRIKTWKKEK